MSFRVAPWAAWHFPSLELRAANSYTCLILDLDGWGSYERAERAVRRTKVGALNWAVENKRTGGRFMGSGPSPTRSIAPIWRWLRH